MFHIRLTLFCLVFFLASCVEPADNRAVLDERVGEATSGEANVRVERGLAKIRDFGGEELHMWAQAPVLTLNVETGESRTWTIHLENTLDDAELTLPDADDADGADIEALPTDEPTVKRWEVTFPSNGRHTLHIAPPDSDDTSPWHFAVFADVQDRLDDVDDIYRKMKRDDSIRFCLISGDLTEDGTPEQLSLFQKKMKQLPYPCFATLGNHELGDGDDNFHNFFGRGNFSFEFRGARFTLLDSASATIAPTVYDWLDGWLAEGRNLFHMVMMHIPPLDPAGIRNGAFASRAEANKLLEMFAANDVDLTIYGHLHSYYTYANAGIESYITGGGGAIPDRYDGMGRHYMKIKVFPDEQSVEASVIRIEVED